jgi:hypothetical protein
MPPIMKEFVFDDQERTAPPIKRLLRPLRRLLWKYCESTVAR